MLKQDVVFNIESKEDDVFASISEAASSSIWKNKGCVNVGPCIHEPTKSGYRDDTRGTRNSLGRRNNFPGQSYDHFAAGNFSAGKNTARDTMQATIDIIDRLPWVDLSASVNHVHNDVALRNRALPTRINAPLIRYIYN